jgi:hypothetical protein
MTRRLPNFCVVSPEATDLFLLTHNHVGDRTGLREARTGCQGSFAARLD